MFQFSKPTPGSAPLLAALFALCLMFMTAGPAAALTVGERLRALESRVVTLESKVVALDSKVVTQQRRISEVETALVQQTAVNSVQVNQISSLQATVQKQHIDNVARNSQVAGLADKLFHVSRVGSSLFISGANLHIVNGMNETDTTNGLGNLIVGYNESRGIGDVRSGSHNVLLGSFLNFSSYGGIAAGFHNSVSGPYASVSGGQYNAALGFAASVSGGQSNTAQGFGASVSGGQFNMASGSGASVSGGTSNTASGAFASVSGGRHNKASGESAAVSGGGSNTASGGVASVTGGFVNKASGQTATVGGGLYNTASGSSASVSGGYYRAALDPYDWRSGSLFQDQ